MKTDANLHPFGFPTKCFHLEIVILTQILTIFLVCQYIFTYFQQSHHPQHVLSSYFKNREQQFNTFRAIFI